MTKRKTTKKTAAWDLLEAGADQPEVQTSQTRPIRSIYESRLIIGPAQTLSGSRYEFSPGQVIQVLTQDHEHLLSLHQKNGCCGGPLKPQYYFEEVI